MGLAIIVPSISFADANLGKVTLSGNVPIRGLDINLKDSYFGTEVDLNCSYLPVNTTQRGVVWSIVSGSEYASISGSTLTILSNANNNNVTIKCTSALNPKVTTEKTITVTYNNPIYSIKNHAVNGDVSKIITLDYDLLTGLSEWTLVFKGTRNNNTTCNYFAMTCLKGTALSYNEGGIYCKNAGRLICTIPYNNLYEIRELVQLNIYDVKIALKRSNDKLFYSVDGTTWVNTNYSVSDMNSLSGYNTPKLVLGGGRNPDGVLYPLQGSFSAYLFDEVLDNVSYLL